MKSTPFAVAIVCGLVAALFYVSVLTGSLGATLILFYLTQFPLFLAGLSLGLPGAVVAAATAGIATLPAGGFGAGFVVLALPVVILVGQALRRRGGVRAVWNPPGRLVLSLVLTGAVALLGVAALYGPEPGGLRGAVHHLLETVADEILRMIPDVAPANAGASAADLLTPVFPAVVIGWWLVLTAVNGALAQGALASFRLNRRPAPDMAQLTLPRWLTGLLAACALLGATAPGGWGYIGLNLAIVLALAYVLAGLSVLHAALRRFPRRLFILIPAYLLLPLGWPALLLAACGIVDQWFGLRPRLAAPCPA